MSRIRSRVEEHKIGSNRARRYFVLTLFALAGVAILARAVYLQHYQQSLLQAEGDNRHIRTVDIPGHRGDITDRFGKWLAISTPVYTVSIDPQRFRLEDLSKLAALPGLDVATLKKRIERQRKNKRRHLYVKRQLPPAAIGDLHALRLPGLYIDVEYRRYYPMGEVAAHLVGITDIDEKGIEGVEKALDDELRGAPGKRKVVRDLYDSIIAQLEVIKQPVYGGTVDLSIDQRIQYRAYSALQAATRKHKARSGSVVVLDVKSGEVLAIVNQPSFNPNQRGSYDANARRNRSSTDMFEPGSTMKPFIVASLLESDNTQLNAEVNTSPGFYLVEGNRIEDIRDWGTLSLSEIIYKSSNVGISKLATQIPKATLWKHFDVLGFGRVPGTGFPGETAGRLHSYRDWSLIDHASISYGYGVAVSMLQLVNSYSVFANDGWKPRLSFRKGNPYFEKIEVFSPATARHVREMLKQVTLPEGTGSKAKIEGYSTAGKTGTVRKFSKDPDAPPEYLSLFVGFAPANAPRLAAAVMIDTPSGKEYYGGEVAGPIFAEVMAHALRTMNIPRDEHVSSKFSDAKGFQKVSSR